MKATPGGALLLTLLLPALSGCGDSGSPGAAASLVRDSAGISIVENTGPSWRPGEEWRLADAPEVQIGSLDGAPEYQLFQVRAGTVLPDGRIVVANGGTSELRFYSADGRHLRTAGREGGGPGEFQTPITVEVHRDSLHVFDVGTRQMSVWTLDGEYARSHALGAESRSLLTPRGRFSDGALAFGGMDLPPPQMLGVANGEMRRDHVFLRLSESGEVLDSIGSFPGARQVVQTQGEPGRIAVMIRPVLFTSNPAAVAGGDRFVFGSGDRYEIAFHRPDGSLDRLVRRQHTPEPVTDAHLRALDEVRREETRAVTRIGGGGSERPPPAPPDPGRAADQPHADHFPAFSDLLLDPDGNVWVRPFRKPGESGAQRFDLFDPEGTYLGIVELPEGFRPLEIGEEYVLGVWSDALEIEHVQLYRLIKG